MPPLPEILSEQLRLQVFTHRSFFARPTHIFEDMPDDPSPDNEMYVPVRYYRVSFSLLTLDAIMILGSSILGTPSSAWS